MNPVNHTYSIYNSGGGWVVFDVKNEVEVCICNTYEEEQVSAIERAKLISLSLNTLENR